MKQCERGHIYDDKAYAVCPYCSQNGAVGTRPLDVGGTPEFPRTAPIDGGTHDFPKTAPLDVSSAPDFPATQPVNVPARPKKEMSATIALNASEAGISPVCGWVVVAEGDNKGMFYPVHSDKNSIGRGSRFDINLTFDNAISKDGDAVITYDSRGKKFFVTLSSGKNNIYHNGELLLTPKEIKDYDVIEIGKTKLIFRSFCNEGFTY